jgi:hypothetical protein
MDHELGVDWTRFILLCQYRPEGLFTQRQALIRHQGTKLVRKDSSNPLAS